MHVQRARESKRRGVGWGLLLTAALMSGCAYSYVAPDGSRHVVGLVYAVLPPEGSAKVPAASLRTRTLGLSFVHGDVGSAVTLGFSDITLAYVRSNTCVRWPLSPSSERTFR